MKLKIDMGALEGERVINGLDDKGRIDGTLSIFLLGTKDKVYFAGDAKARLRFAWLIVTIADQDGDWTATGLYGEMERWARKVIAQK